MAAAAPDMEAVIEKGVAELSQALPDCDPAQLRQMVTGVTHLSAADLIVALIAALAERVELSQKLKVNSIYSRAEPQTSIYSGAEPETKGK